VDEDKVILKVQIQVIFWQIA